MRSRRRGKPLRFLGTVASGWVGLRVFLLWPQIASPADILPALAPAFVARAEPGPAVASPRAAASTQQRIDPIAIRLRSGAVSTRRAPDPTKVALALLGLVRYGDPQPAEDSAPILPGLPRARPPRGEAARLPSRWSGSFWLVARSGSGIAPGTLGGQLGGSQAGARLAYMVDRKHRVALAARVTSPLGAGSREAALGVEWQPTRLPVRLVAEERFVPDSGAHAPAVGIVGGFGPVGLPAGFRLEGYGQAGAIHRGDTQFYADGAVRVAHTLTTIGPARIDLGAGVWGAAQRGAARLDVGPSLGLTVSLGKQPVRLAIDWRQRVVGDARPDSGPALTLGTDF